MTNADNADDLALQANKPTPAESLLHNLDQAARDIGLYVNADQTEFLCLKDGAISTLNGKTSEVNRPIHIHQLQYLIY